jgi:4-hydroxy 2-oxovalerate aldolase
MRLLDCTLRDGGYYNNWDFPTDLVRRYVRGLVAAGIDTIELGFRSLGADGYLGALAHTTDTYLLGLNLPDSASFGVMLNAKELVGFDAGANAAIDRLFAPASDSPVDLVRIAATQSEVQGLNSAVERLHELGYRTGVNLMQVHTLTSTDLADFGEWAHSVGAEVAYFADSFGVLNPADIGPIASALKEGFKGPVGCHLHDNRALAMANTLAAVDAGVTWVDGTIRGMGRGPGNARTEYLAVELTRRGLINADLTPLISVVEEDFAALHREFEWGTNLHYMLSGTHGVHPTYVQRMIADPRFSPAQITDTIERLGVEGGSSFDLDQAADDISESEASAYGSWNASAWCSGRPVLIIGPGETVADRRSDLEHVIRSTDSVVLNLNLRPLVDPELIDAYVACNPVRARLDRTELTDDGVRVIAPRAHMGNIVDGLQVDDWGMSVKAGQFEVSDTGCTLPSGVVAGYAIAIATAGGASRVLLAGLDGFDHADPRQLAMSELLTAAQSRTSTPAIVSLTPTTYPVVESSLYAPWFR